MSKSNHFFGQPLYGQLINLLDKEISDTNITKTINFKERIVNVKLKDICTWSTEHLSKKLGYRTNQNA